MKRVKVEVEQTVVRYGFDSALILVEAGKRLALTQRDNTRFHLQKLVIVPDLGHERPIVDTIVKA
jgi:hypothetical protein